MTSLSRLSDEEQAFVAVVSDFVERRVIPDAATFEATDTYPEALVDEMKKLGIFGLLVPEPYGDAAVSTACFAAVTEELARGWMSMAGAMGGHSVVVHLLNSFGTEEQRQRFLPRLATGELRATMALTEPDGGSDLQNIRTSARRVDDHYLINGSKTWISNARHAGLLAVLCKTDTHAEPAHRGISVMLVEPGPGLTIASDLKKLGYRGVEACELVFTDYQAPETAVLGMTPGHGFSQMMNGLELGRVQVAARATGVARAAFDASLRYAKERTSFGVPIWQHQSIGNYLADMATKLSAARLLLFAAADAVESGRRADLEAGMAKLYASEICMQITELAVRIHGSNGYSVEYLPERLYRDAPLMVVGEGTNEIQRSIIARQLVQRGGLPPLY